MTQIENSAVKSTDVKPGRVISFSGAGWLWYYELGAAAALHDAGLADHKTSIYAGASGGAIVAAISAGGLHHTAPHRLAYDMHQAQYADWRTLFRLDECVGKGVAQMESEFTKDPQWRETLARGLRIYMTELQAPVTAVARYRSRFGTYQDLQQTLVGSCLVPGFAGWFLRLKSSPEQEEIDEAAGWSHRGQEPIIVDGGFLNLQPMQFSAGEGAIFVSPFWWQLGAQVRPRYMPTLWALRPPQHWPKYEWLYTFGYSDAMTYAVRQNAISREAAESIFQKRFGFPSDEVVGAQPLIITHTSRSALVLGVLWALRREFRRGRRGPR